MKVALCHPERPYLARGMCQKCYDAAKWRGDFKPTRKRREGENVVEHIAARTVVTATGCHEWTGSRSQDGYATVNIDGKTTKASRVVLEAKLGRSIKDGYFALHRCDNPPCVNPEHLFEGTLQDNTADMVTKRRQAWGNKIGASRLSPELVKAIRASTVVPYSRTQSFSRLARQFGISANAVRAVWKGESWKQLTT